MAKTIEQLTEENERLHTYVLELEDEIRREKAKTYDIRYAIDLFKRMLKEDFDV